MAYFANGTEIDYNMDKYCWKCVHAGDCPILELHELWNYDACNGDLPKATPEQKAKFVALETLWPRDGKCLMFIRIESESK